MKTSAIAIDPSTDFAHRHMLPELPLRAIVGVMKHAQEGELPLVAWTLGLPQAELLELIEHCFPKLGRLEPMPEWNYAILMRIVPQVFHDLAALLLAHRDGNTDARHADWLARAIAAASLGERHLWQDLGLDGRGDVAALLQRYFPTLFARNTADLKWKRFLFAELGAAQGRPDLLPPGCGKCGQFPICFAVSKTSEC